MAIRKILLIAGILSIVIIAMSLSGCTYMQNAVQDNTSTDDTPTDNTPADTIAPDHHVQITGSSISVNYTGTASGYFGSTRPDNTVFNATSSQPFTYTITLANKIGDAHNIDNITVTTPGFTLTSVKPDLPVKLTEGTSVTFTLTIMPPDADYTGPLGYMVYTS